MSTASYTKICPICTAKSLYSVIFVIIVVLVVILAAIAVFARNKSGSGNALLGQMRTKQDNLEHILNMFNERDQITSHDVEKLLGVSAATANNYLDELLAHDLVKQHGSNTGYIYTRK